MHGCQNPAWYGHAAFLFEQSTLPLGQLIIRRRFAVWKRLLNVVLSLRPGVKATG